FYGVFIPLYCACLMAHANAFAIRRAFSTFPPVHPVRVIGLKLVSIARGYVETDPPAPGPVAPLWLAANPPSLMKRRLYLLCLSIIGVPLLFLDITTIWSSSGNPCAPEAP